MNVRFNIVTFAFLLIVTSSACSSISSEEVGCNFESGATNNEYDKESSGSSNFFNDVFLGLFNIAFQGAHRSVSPSTYDQCSKKDIANCIDADGNIKKECKLTK
jgi:hypothetical protein